MTQAPVGEYKYCGKFENCHYVVARKLSSADTVFDAIFVVFVVVLVNKPVFAAHIIIVCISLSHIQY
jgi:hypothetical protein